MTAHERAEKMAELSSIKDLAVARDAAVSRVKELLEDEDVDVRAEAAGAVWSYPEKQELLARVLELAGEDGEASVRRRALTALGRVILEGDLAGAEGEDYVPERELGEPPAELYRETKGLLLSVLGRDDPIARRCALESLSYLSHQEEVVEAIKGLLDDEDPEVRVCAMRCMGRSGDPRWGEAICEAIEASDQAVVVQAIRAAGESEATVAVPILVRILRGSRQPQQQRVEAARALACLGGENTAAALLEVAENESDEVVREAAREALGCLTLLSEPQRGGSDDDEQ